MFIKMSFYSSEKTLVVMFFVHMKCIVTCMYRSGILTLCIMVFRLYIVYLYIMNTDINIATFLVIVQFCDNPTENLCLNMLVTGGLIRGERQNESNQKTVGEVSIQETKTIQKSRKSMEKMNKIKRKMTICLVIWPFRLFKHDPLGDRSLQTNTMW